MEDPNRPKTLYESLHGVPDAPKDAPKEPKASQARPKKRTPQEEFARRVVCGQEGDAGQWEYEMALRVRLLKGYLAPALEMLVLYYLYGKPMERIEVKDKTSPLRDVSIEELRARHASFVQACERRKAQDEPEPDESIH